MNKTLAIPLVLLAVACQHHESGDGGDSSSSGAEQESVGSATATTTTATTATTATTDGTDTGDEDPDPYGGDWCGNASNGGALAMGNTRDVIQFAGAGANPIPMVGWVDDGGQVSIARYDVASAAWGEPDVVATDLSIDTVVSGTYAVGTVAATGDAWIGYASVDPTPHMVVLRLDPTTLTWAHEDLPELFEQPHPVGVLHATTGHAALWASDVTMDGAAGQAAVWFFDPASHAWTAVPDTGFESWSTPDSMLGASDPVTGDMVLAKDGDAGAITTWHYAAATGQAERADIEVTGEYLSSIEPLGDGAFMLVTRETTFDGPYEVHARRFDGAAWQSPETLGSGTDLAGVHSVADGAGRVGVTWTDYDGGASAATFAAAQGWSVASVLQATDPSSPGAVAWERIAIEDDGMFVAWAGWQTSIVTPHSSHFDGQSWSASVPLDPDQPTQFTELVSLDSLGPNRARATWKRYDDFGGNSYVYACHAPMSGWSFPVGTGQLLRVEPRANGEVLVVTGQADEAYAQYFAAVD